MSKDEILETKEESPKEPHLDCAEENAKKVVEQIQEDIRKEAGVSDEQAEIFKKMLDEANMPVEFLDKDFKLGPQELDVRKLSKKNLIQMFFRQGVLHQVYLKQILSSLVDITRLNLVLLDKLGVPNITEAIDDILDKLSEQTNIKQVVKDAKGKKPENKAN